MKHGLFLFCLGIIGILRISAAVILETTRSSWKGSFADSLQFHYSFYGSEKSSDKVRKLSPHALPKGLETALERQGYRYRSITFEYSSAIFPTFMDGLQDIAVFGKNLGIKYREGEPVSFLGKYRGVLRIDSNALITPPGQAGNPSIFRYGVITSPGRSISTRGLAVRWSAERWENLPSEKLLERLFDWSLW